jgi:hypothetical protein
VPTGDCCGGAFTHGAAYLGPEHGGVRLNTDPENPLPFIRPPEGALTAEEQAANLSLLGKLNRLAGIDYPDDQNLRARIKAYELAYQMQSSIPETMQLDGEPEHIRRLYGLDQEHTKAFGEQCLVARRLVERGVRFVQLFHEAWDHHSDVKGGVRNQAGQTDRASAALVRDLKRRGLLDEVIVVWGGEFGRTPQVEASAELSRSLGRDHHPQAFTYWLAGGGAKAGVTVGETDDFGFNVVKDKVHVHDLHATLLHLLGFDHEKLTHRFQGRDYRLTDVHGEVVSKIVA